MLCLKLPDSHEQRKQNPKELFLNRIRHSCCGEESFFHLVFPGYFPPFSPFISSHLAGRIGNYVHGLLLSISKAKYVPRVVTDCVCILSEFSHPEQRSVSSVALALRACDTMVTVPWQSSWRLFAQCDMPPCFVHFQGLWWCDPLLETRGHFILTWTKGVNYWKAWRS